MEKGPQKILAVVGIGTVLSLVYSGINYATQIALVELFGYRLRGVYEILLSILGLASVLFSFNLYTVLNLHISKNRAAPENLRSVGTVIVAIQIFATIVLYGISPKDETLTGKFWLPIFALLVLAALLNHKVNEFTAILNGNHYFIEAKKLTLVGGAFTALLILATFFVGFRSGPAVLWIAVIGPFLGSYIYSRFLRSKIPELTRQSGILSWMHLYKESTAVYIISLAQFLSLKLYLLYIGRSQSVEMLGVFSLSYSLIQFLLLPATFLATIIISNKSDRLGGFSKSFRSLIGYSVLSCAGLILFIELGFLHMVPLKSMHNPLFGRVLEVMSLSIPPSVLNVLIVAIAIRKGVCSRQFVVGQLLLIPLPFAFSYVASSMLQPSGAISASYVSAWVFSSLFSAWALQKKLTKNRIGVWPESR